MNPNSNLPDLNRNCQKRIAKLLMNVSATSLVNSSEMDQVAAFVSIELLNIWAGFSRSLYLSSCYGAQDRFGTKVQTKLSHASEYDCILIAGTKFNKIKGIPPQKLTHRDEPSWIPSRTLMDLLDTVKASNPSVVVSALSAGWRVLDDLPTIRNFYAHRGKTTGMKAMRLATTYRLPPNTHPTKICFSRDSSSGNLNLVTWALELSQIVELAVDRSTP